MTTRSSMHLSAIDWGSHVYLTYILMLIRHLRARKLTYISVLLTKPIYSSALYIIIYVVYMSFGTYRWDDCQNPVVLVDWNVTLLIRTNYIGLLTFDEDNLCDFELMNSRPSIFPRTKNLSRFVCISRQSWNDSIHK